jgi:hypothetical protein
MKKGEDMNLSIFTYLVYLVVSISMTIWVAQTLYKNGRYFLVEVFQGDWAMADSVNRLLVVGYYLINLGYISLMLKLGYAVPDMTGAIEALSEKIGMVLVGLGLMHFFNLYIFSRIRRRGSLDRDNQESLPGRQANVDTVIREKAQKPFYRYQSIEAQD